MNEMDQDVEGVELPELDDGGGSSRRQPEPGKKMNPIVFSLIIVVILGVQAVTSFLVVQRVLAANPYFPGSPPGTEATANDDAALTGLLYTLEGLIANPADSRGNNVLLVDIGFETGSEEVVAELGTLEPRLRDNINTFLSAQRLQVLADISMRERIRERVKTIANHNLTTGQVGRVFFISYVLQ